MWVQKSTKDLRVETNQVSGIPLRTEKQREVSDKQRKRSNIIWG